MAIVTIDQNPKVTDTVQFNLTTTDAGGLAIDPYQITSATIYLLSRNHLGPTANEVDQVVAGQAYPTYYQKADVIKVFGNDDNPAWLSTNTTNALLTRTAFGQFTLLWTPEFSREGDYIICWTWVPLIAGTPISSYDTFYLASDTHHTTSLPTHYTQPDKYVTLLDRYTPDLLKQTLSDDDESPTVISNLNLSIADGFTVIEDLVNQVPDLIDANAINEQSIVYLANLFDLVLRSTDSTLWRRQVKRAIPLYKMKGTLAGLTEALASAGITLNAITRLWQVVSSATWQDGFLVSAGNTTFTLSKQAVITPTIDTNNFAIYYRAAGTTSYTTLDTSYVSFSNNSGITTMQWIGASHTPPLSLSNGDFIRVIYKIANPSNQTTENYIRTLPLADQRDETTVTYPPKNWNVRVIAENDAMFSTVCPLLHPFANPPVYGQIRTEFAYSENIYNMEEYNGSIRNSTDPCSLSNDFLDSCNACMSSLFNIDLVIESLSNDRIEEARQIITDFVPFHAQIFTMTFKGGITEFMPPNVESVQTLVQINNSDVSITGQFDHNRFEDNLTRTQLSAPSIIASGVGVARNQEITLSCDGVRFDRAILGINESSNLLEILSGSNAGSYTVYDPAKFTVAVAQGSPSTVPYPLDKSSFPFRLSNQLFSGSVTSVSQDNLFSFSDPNANFVTSGTVSGWHIQVTSPVALAGTYTINNVLPDNSLILASWPNSTNTSGISYQLLNSSSTAVGSSSTTGSITVTSRGLINAGSTVESDFNLKVGDYVLISGTQYPIIDFPTSSTFHVGNYALGGMGVTSVKVYRRLLDNKVGYLSYKGLNLTTPTDYEVTLSITNGANGLGPTLENSTVIEEYLVQLGTNFYQIANINHNLITLTGIPGDMGLSGISIGFSLIYMPKNSITINGANFYVLDRRDNDIATYTVTTAASMGLVANMLEASNSGGIFSPTSQTENIACRIEYK